MVPTLLWQVYQFGPPAFQLFQHIQSYSGTQHDPHALRGTRCSCHCEDYGTCSGGIRKAHDLGWAVCSCSRRDDRPHPARRLACIPTFITLLGWMRERHDLQKSCFTCIFFATPSTLHNHRRSLTTLFRLTPRRRRCPTPAPGSP